MRKIIVKWEIKDVWSPEDELILIKKGGNNSIEWDFIEGSAAQMCVLFPTDGIKTLADLKREGTRPILYHKRLKKNHQIPPLIYCPKAYALYPGIIENGLLYVGDQREGNVVLLEKPEKKSVVINIVREYWILCGLLHREKVQQKQLTLGTLDNILYYKISGEQNYIYTLEIKIGRENFVYLKADQTIVFFKDRACTDEVNI